MSAVMQSAEDDAPPSQQAQRQQWLAVLARSSPDEIASALAKLQPLPTYSLLRAPDCGMIMLRGRAGGTGRRFNLGEATVTRCSLHVQDGAIGHGYVLGRDRRRAEQIALLDALLQDPDRQAKIWDEVIQPLALAQEARRAARDRKTAATKVDFFTMVRGEDE